MVPINQIHINSNMNYARSERVFYPIFHAINAVNVYLDDLMWLFMISTR